jgi:acyl-CoA thioesterase
VSVALAETIASRRALWMTTQFVATAPHGVEVEVHVEELARGKHTSQLRITGSGPEGEVLFASLGACGEPREDAMSGQFETMPRVSPPESSESLETPLASLAKLMDDLPRPFPPRRSGFATAVEVKWAEIEDHPDPGPGRVCLWMRRRDGRPVTPAVAAFMADAVPLSVAHAMGVIGGGTSLDNTMRFAGGADTEWVLLDLRPHFAWGGYGHGSAHVWNSAGELIGTASQTASMIRFDELIRRISSSL